MELEDRVKAAREHARLTQVELVARVRELTGRRFTQQALSKLETGASNASEALAAIAVACGVNAEWLVSGAGDMTSPQMGVHDVEANYASGRQSQPLGLDPDTLSWTVKALLRRDPNRNWLAFMTEHPELFIEAYRLYAERTSDVLTELQLGIKLADLVPLQPRDATGDEREKNVSAFSASGRGVGKGGKRKA